MEFDVYGPIIFPWILGLLSTLLGFCLKGIADYFWLKSPKINIRTELIPKTVEPPYNNYRKYNYELKIEIQNHSKNIAYGLEVKNIVMPTGLLANQNFYMDTQHMVSDTTSVLITDKCSITLPVVESNSSKGASERKDDFGQLIKIELSYKNELGKRYNKKITSEFRKKVTVVNSMKVIGYKPPLKKNGQI